MSSEKCSGSRVQTVLTALILVVLVALLTLFVVAWRTLEPTIAELHATLENTHRISSSVTDMMPSAEKTLQNVEAITDKVSFAVDKAADLNETGGSVANTVSNITSIVNMFKKSQ